MQLSSWCHQQNKPSKNSQFTLLLAMIICCCKWVKLCTTDKQALRMVSTNVCTALATCEGMNGINSPSQQAGAQAISIKLYVTQGHSITSSGACCWLLIGMTATFVTSQSRCLHTRRRLKILIAIAKPNDNCLGSTLRVLWISWRILLDIFFRRMLCTRTRNPLTTKPNSLETVYVIHTFVSSIPAMSTSLWTRQVNSDPFQQSKFGETLLCFIDEFIIYLP